jgi:hypothetical protein
MIFLLKKIKVGKCKIVISACLSLSQVERRHSRQILYHLTISLAPKLQFFLFLFFVFFVVLGFELKAYTLSYSTGSIFVKSFSRCDLLSYLLGLASNRSPPDLYLLSS